MNNGGMCAGALATTHSIDCVLRPSVSLSKSQYILAAVQNPIDKIIPSSSSAWRFFFLLQNLFANLNRMQSANKDKH